MKKIIVTGFVLFALGATWGMAQQTSEKQERSGIHGMMPDMMKEPKSGEGSYGMMQDMQGMMARMMKMMDQCSSMMNQAQHPKAPEENTRK